MGTAAGIVRVLVLEEDPSWRHALAGMYSAILGHRGEVLTAADGAAAERQLRRQAVDVFSLDLSLSEWRPADGPLMCDTGRLQLIELAAKRRWAKGVVLIAKSDAADGQDRFISCDEAKLNEATVSPDEFVRRRFSDRGLVLNKPARWDLAASLAHFEAVIRRRLPDLARAGYTLRFGGTEHDPRVTIEADRTTIAALEGDDARLLLALAKLGRESEFLSDGSVLAIYRGDSANEGGAADVTRVAQREVDGFRRRVRRQGVNDRALIRRVRKSDAEGSTTGAWRLDGSVVAEGLATVGVRGRGGVEFRPDVADPR